MAGRCAHHNRVTLDRAAAIGAAAMLLLASTALGARWRCPDGRFCDGRCPVHGAARAQKASAAAPAWPSCCRRAASGYAGHSGPVLAADRCRLDVRTAPTGVTPDRLTVSAPFPADLLVPVSRIRTTRSVSRVPDAGRSPPGDTPGRTTFGRAPPTIS